MSMLLAKEKSFLPGLLGTASGAAAVLAAVLALHCSGPSDGLSIPSAETGLPPASSPAVLEHYRKGMAAARSDPAEAAAQYRLAASLDPEFAPARYRLALTDIQLLETREAREAVEHGGRGGDGLPEAFRPAALALTSFVRGELDRAYALAEEGLAGRPDDPDLHFIAGMTSACSCSQFDPNSVIDHLEKALAGGLGGSFIRQRLQEAYAMKRMDNWMLERALQYRARHPDLADAIAEVGRVRIIRGEYGDALEAADNIIRQGRDIFARGLAPAFILSGRNEDVAVLYDPEMESNNTRAANILTHLHAGINDVWRGNFAKAIEHFERGPEFLTAPWQTSRRALFLLLAGSTETLQGRWVEAEEAFAASGHEPVIEYVAGVNDLRAGDTAQAQRRADELARERRRSRPGWTEPWRRLLIGEIALSRGDVDRAVEMFREAWALEMPLGIDCIAGHVDAYFLDALGRGYQAQGRREEALRIFDQISALGSRGLNQPAIAILALYRSGVLLASLGHPQRARRRLERFVRLWGERQAGMRQVRDAKRRLEVLRTPGR